MGGDGLYDGEFIKLAGADAGRGRLLHLGRPADRQAARRARSSQAAYKAKFPNDEIAAYDAYSYDATNVIINAVLKVADEQGADKVTSPAGRDAIIAAVAATNTEGVTGDDRLRRQGRHHQQGHHDLHGRGRRVDPKVIPGE